MSFLERKNSQSFDVLPAGTTYRMVPADVERWVNKKT